MAPMDYPNVGSAKWHEFTSLAFDIKVFNKPHKGFWRDILCVRRSRKPAENAAQRKKDHLWMETK